MTRVALLIACLLPSLAMAQAGPSPDALQVGKREFEAGRTEFNLGNYDEALAHFEASYRRTGKPGLLYNLGVAKKRLFERTHELGKLEQAIEHFRAFLANTQSADDAGVREQRARAEKDLADAEDEATRERSARARGDEMLRLAEDLLATGQLGSAKAQLERYEHNADPPNERPGVVRAYALHARIAAAENAEPAAIDAWARALSLDRAVTPRPDADEPTRRAFASARDKLAGSPTVNVTHAPAGSLRPGAPVELAFHLASDPLGLVAGIDLYYRIGAGAYARLPRTAAGKLALPSAFTAALPPAAHVEYYAEVVDDHGAILEHLGSAQVPFAVEVQPKEAPHRRPLTSKWWFWTATIGVVAVAATGIGLGIYYSQPQPQRVPITVAVVAW